MKKYATFLLFFLGVSRPAGADIPAGMVQVQSLYYEVLSDSGVGDAQLLANELDSRFLLYNGFFHFNPQRIAGAPLKVRSFKDPAEYNAYIGERLDKTSPGAVYLHYSQPDQRELVIHRESPEADKRFPHQAFVQFLRAFVPNPPSWLREGFAIYYSSVRYEPAKPGSSEKNPAGGLVYEENLSWLDAIKTWGNRAPPLETILLADTKNVFPDNFQGLSWALVSFLKDGGYGDYLRYLYEAFILLKDSGTVQDNAEILYNHMKSWTDSASLERDYRAYLLTRKSFNELIIEGQRAYSAKDYRQAEAVFQQALRQRPNHYAPYYYLGLLAYDAKNYSQAEQYYGCAQQYGADPGLIAYALGINAAAAGNNAKAVSYLNQAKAASPAQYNDQVDNLIKRLR
ncbi:MAG: hypothetical protein LBG90_01225 [Spirochaetaceae bacterium]|jgi:tetratricopeptide (TPR) repeat protein|nr:hypothetical protein [Spirochaetaceae bacterium]